MGLGGYPDITLRRARELADACRSQKAERIDPLAERAKGGKLEQKPKTLRQFADEFFDKKKRTLKDGGEAGGWWSPVTTHVIPVLGEKPLSQIGIDEIVACFEPIWVTKYPTAKKALARLSQVITYGSATTHYDLQILVKAKAMLGDVKHKPKHQRAVAWKEIPAVYAELGHSVADRSLRFYMLTVPRVQNVTKAVWSEIALNRGIWAITADRMKSEVAFWIPLSWQAKDILRLMGPKQDPTAYIFASPAAYKKGVISENTWNKGFKSRNRDTTAHGIRSSFCDWAVDTNVCDEKMAEFCIQHQTRTKEGRAYLRTARLEERRVIMDKWAEFVTGKTVHDYAEVLDDKTLVEFYKEGGDVENWRW